MWEKAGQEPALGKCTCVCSGLCSLSWTRPVSSGAQSAAWWVLFPAGSHNRRTYVFGPDGSMGVVPSGYTGSWGPAGIKTLAPAEHFRFGAAMGQEADPFHLRFLLRRMGKSSSGGVLPGGI